ncbi:MAG: ribosome small subunit-dependent GTPase A [Planctomycetota bacterium]|jgi:ribosome biogenesis GTPase
MDNLKKLGFINWFRKQLDENTPHEIARVVSVHKGSYFVTKGENDIYAQLSGSFSYSVESSLDLPTTGDWVYAGFHDDDAHATIHGVIPRKTLLKRKTAGKTVDFQLIAANIDTAFIMQSLDCNLNLNRLERYLVMVNESKALPVILLSKCDLMSEEEIEEIRESILNISPHTTVTAFSNMNGENIELIKNYLQPQQTYCLLGSSGVGKTTLLNSILGADQFRTQTVSKKENKGRHTTTSRELIQLDNGAFLIDTPGMRELGNMSVDNGLDDTFSDIIELAENCKFRNCSHIEEKGCAVIAAVEKDVLSEQRHKNYLKMKREADFNEMSYVEKRKKDKAFGKMVKSVMKDKKKQKPKGF